MEEGRLWRRVIESIHQTPRTWPALPYNKKINGTWGTIAKIDNFLASSQVSLIKEIKGVVGNGLKIQFWLDVWLDGYPLKKLYPNLFSLEASKGCLVADRCRQRDGVIMMN